MITAKFSKIDYSRFLSHLDLQTIINRAIKRAGFIINYSQGFNPHPILKMSPPIPLGIKSSAEYFTTDIFVQDKGIFEEKIRDTLPKGIKIINTWQTEDQPKIAALSSAIGYSLNNLNRSIIRNILDEEESIISAFNRPPEEIKIMEDSGERLLIILPSGKNNIRIDTFISVLKEKFELSLKLTDVEKTILFLSHSNETINADKYLDFLSEKSFF
ncbi:MAG: hypothetical protein BWX72_00752 [Firmicutes bacterium ADurb.Bin080]|jgi:radical SAM-linked protein|nr:DUF2344 domain-containing protein [Clostridiales bacterium]OQC16031.1 MAG: hypothetical protein BWX72_00752 [Firmicutes bacterium ADurb.Bin080]